MSHPVGRNCRSGRRSESGGDSWKEEAISQQAEGRRKLKEGEEEDKELTAKKERFTGGSPFIVDDTILL